MTSPETHFRTFTAAYERGEDPNPQDYLEQLSGRERFVLEGMIERYLETEAPLRRYDAAAFEAERDRPVLRRVAEIAADPTSWHAESPLQLARERERLTREQLASALLERVGLGDGPERRRTKAVGYLAAIEHGELAWSRVSRRVRDALGDVLGALPAATAPQPGPAFRADEPQAAADAGEALELLADAFETPDPDGWDEIDVLFRGPS